MRLINLRIDDQLLDEIEKIAIEKFDDNTSEAIRHLCRLGIDLEKIKPHELDQSKIEEITNEMNQKIKDESFFEFINLVKFKIKKTQFYLQTLHLICHVTDCVMGVTAV